MKPDVFIGMVVMLAGYTLGWWGWETLQDTGVGLRDLLTPSSVAIVDTARGNPKGPSNPAVVIGAPTSTTAAGSVAPIIPQVR